MLRRQRDYDGSLSQLGRFLVGIVEDGDVDRGAHDIRGNDTCRIRPR